MSLREGFPPDNEQDKRGPPLTLHAPDLGRVFAVASHGTHTIILNLTSCIHLAHFSLSGYNASVKP